MPSSSIPPSAFRVPSSEFPSSSLYCILDLGYTPEQNAEEVTAQLLAGGADLLQLRAKGHDLATIQRVAEKLIPLCRAAGVPFILNDHPALAAQLGADGVHIGQDDGPLDRGIHSALPSPSSNPKSKIQNPKFLFGRSTHSLAQARAALAEGFDYIGFGPIFPTPTKLGRPAIGLDDIAAMEREVGSKIPAFCIGGITPKTLPQVLAAGARRVVIVSALLQAKDPQSATQSAKAALNSELETRNAE
jgi:thiamine-phosphate pyrophosphorylase